MGDTCQVLVLGGGPAGCATAIALAGHGVSGVRVAAPRRRDPTAVGETLLPDTGVLLEELGVLERFLAEGHEPCLGTRSAWGADAVGHNDFILNVRGRGWHLDRARFDAFLLAEAEAAGATVLRDTRFTSCENAVDGGVRVRLARPGGPASSVHARFVVDATGARAVFARSQGASRVRRDRLVFVYGFFAASSTSAAFRLTMIEAVETGWWYAAGLPRERVAVAFAGDPEFVRERGMAQRDRWLSRLLMTRHIAPRLDGCRLQPGLVARVAPSGLTDPVGGDHWLAVGDAAASYDPLSGEGIHKALSNGIDAAEAVALALRSDVERADAYCAQVVEQFEAYRVERAGFYAAEQRWEAAPFWRRRRALAGRAETAES